MTSFKISNTYVYDIFAYVLCKFRVIVNGKDYVPKKDLAYLQQEIGDIIITYQVQTRELFRRHLSQHGAWVRLAPADACSGLVKEVLAVGVLDGFDTIFCAAALVLETFLFLQGERHVFSWSFADAFADILRQTLEEPLTEEILTTDGKNFRLFLHERLSKLYTLHKSLLPCVVQLRRPYDAFCPQTVSKQGSPLFHDLPEALACGLGLDEPQEEKPHLPFLWDDLESHCS